MSMQISLTGQVAVVTGASRGIGAAIATSLAAAGAHLVLTARDEERLIKLRDAIQAKHKIECLTIAADVTDAKAVQDIYKQVHSRFGRLDILAANAGILGDALIGMIRDEEIQQTLGVNITGILNHLQPAARLMRRQKSGSIIITSSIIGRVGNKGQAVYAASKAGALGIMMVAAKELGPDGIRVNALAPGFIDTDMTQHISPAIRAERLAGVALGRAGTAEDVAGAALFLASDLARYISGQVIGVDGCMTI